jgi:glycosyltransferase involved in cell wall biosynthesis
MTVLSDASPAHLRAPAPLDARWRAAAEKTQTAALPEGRAVVSCPAPFGVGGLGRHLQEILGALTRGGRDAICLCEGGAHAGAPCQEVRLGPGARAGTALARPFHAWRMWAVSAAFDAAAARRLPVLENLIAFNGTALEQFAAARGAGAGSLCLMSANPHMRQLLRRHAAAHSQYPLERPWATRLEARNLREYAGADRIFVSSRYIWQSFLDQGYPEERLSLFPLTPDARFTPGAQAPPSSGSFDIVYVGALTVHKGVPLLIDAVRRLAFPDLRLVLIGGWKTRGMRRFICSHSAADPRISVAPGDPLPRLRAARLYVHPAYEEGFGYAPAEALACGVPVIASEDTGMKELIEPGRNGLVVPTGELDALTEAIAAAYRGEILGA